MTLNTIAKSIRSLTSIKGSTNDVLHKWLKTFGIEGATNDLLVKQLEALGYTGSLNDMLAAIESDTFVESFRNLIQLDPVANSHYELAKPVTFAGDFEIEVEFASTGDGASQRIIASTSVNEGFDVYYDGGVQQVKFKTAVGGSLEFKGNTDTAEKGKLHKILFSRTSDTFSLVVNGGAPATQVRAGVAVDVGFFGCTSNIASFLDGIISNVVLRDLDTPSNTQTFKLNQLNSDIEYPVENVLGSELWGSPVINAGWTDDGDGTYTHTGAQSEIYVESTLVEDEAYLCRFEVIGAGLATIQLGGAPTNGKNKATNIPAGIHEILLSAESIGGLNRIRVLSATDVTVSNISVKQITNAVNYIVIDQGLPDRDTYTLVDGYWTGSDIVTQDIWENPVTQGAQWAYDAGSNTWALVGDGNLSALQLIFTSLQPDVLQVAGSISGLTGDGLRLANSGTSVVIRQDGNYSEILDKTTDDGQVFKRSTGVVNATITKPTIKRLIEVA